MFLVIHLFSVEHFFSFIHIKRNISLLFRYKRSKKRNKNKYAILFNNNNKS